MCVWGVKEVGWGCWEAHIKVVVLGGSHMGTFSRPCGRGGGGIERHWGGVNPHSPRPSLSRAGHKKPRPPPPESPRWPLTPRLRLLSLAPLCLHPVIICNIYSFWFPCWPLSSPTQHSWLTGKLKCSPSYSSITPETLKPSANTTWSGNESAYDHLFMTLWFRPQGAAQKSSSKWMDGVKEVLRQGRLVVKMHHIKTKKHRNVCWVLLSTVN